MSFFVAVINFGMDADTARIRLVARDSVLPSTAPCVTQVARAFLAVQAETGQGRVSAQNTFLRELGLLEVHLRKAASVATICTNEKAHYHALEDEIRKDISTTQHEISQLHKLLGEERLVRQRKEECEALAVQVNKEAPRIETDAAVADVSAELAALQMKQDEVKFQFDLRQRQFKLLMHSIAELNQVLNPASSPSS